MILRFRNHPSIILWSLGNEEQEQGSPRGLKICTTMKRRARELDPTRLSTFAMNGSWGEGLSKVIDVQGFNYFQEHLDMDVFHRSFPRLPCIGTEIGSNHTTRGIYENDKERGYFSSYDMNHASYSSTPEYWWKYFDDRPWLAGGFVWAGFDYRGEAKPYAWPCASSHSGVLDTCGFPKENFYYYRAWWKQEPMLHVFPHWNWEGREGQEIDVWCYSNLDSVELFLNGASLGVKRVEPRSHIAWKVKYAPGVLDARGMKDGRLVLTAKRETTGAPARIRMRADRMSIRADAEDVAVLSAEVLDREGRIVPTASNAIEFTISGPGKIVGVGNGDPSCHEPDKADRRSAFNGFCMAIVQSRKQPGGITIRATSPGLEAAEVVVTSDAVTPRSSVA